MSETPQADRMASPELQEVLHAALAKWKALPDDERNGERPYIMGFTDGWDEAAEAILSLTSQVVAMREGLAEFYRVAFNDGCDEDFNPDTAIARFEIALASPPESRDGGSKPLCSMCLGEGIVETGEGHTQRCDCTEASNDKEEGHHG